MRARALLAALAAAQVAYGLARARRGGPQVGATRAIVGLSLATSLAEAVDARGPRATMPVLAAGAAGFGAEVAGVATGRPFGRYSYSERLGPRVAGVPLLAAAAWAIMARPAWVAAGLISSRPLRRVPLAAAALTAWDVYLDPRMARDGYWTWPGGGRYAGVPATNFAGWFVTGLGIFAVWALMDRRPPGRRDDGALALYVWTWAGEGFANAALWRERATALAGGAAMGAVAVPALARRLGR
jgi:uncharacterized membrane protein